MIERVSRDARVPVIKHLDGICHVYVSAHADLPKAQRIAFNAKTYRYGICGAMETPAGRPGRGGAIFAGHG